MTDSYDPEVERLLAELAFDPMSRGGNAALIGGGTVNWRTLPDAQAPGVWAALREWVEWFTVRYNIPVSTVPPCWWKHDALVEELSALRTAHEAAFDPSDTGFGPIGWHERLSIALPRLNRAYGGGCSSEHRSTKSRNWEGVTDDAEWTAWVTKAHAQPSAPSGAPTQREEES